MASRSTSGPGYPNFDASGMHDTRAHTNTHVTSTCTPNPRVLIGKNRVVIDGIRPYSVRRKKYGNIGPTSERRVIPTGVLWEHRLRVSRQHTRWTPTFTPLSIDAADKCSPSCTMHPDRRGEKGPIPIPSTSLVAILPEQRYASIFTTDTFLHTPHVGHVRPALACIYV